MIAHLLLTVVLDTTFATQRTAGSDSPCASTIVLPTGLDLWQVAYQRVQEHQYRTAARAYYQLFLCSDRGWSPINPLVRDYNQMESFDAAVDAATQGKFITAIAALKSVLNVLPQFGEARFLMGVFQWSAGMHAQARATWSKTITARYFTQPPDFDQTPRVVTEAAKYLWWASERN